MKGFHVECQKCHSNNYKIEHDSKLNMAYDDSFTEHYVYLVCKECSNKTSIYEYVTAE